VTAGLRENDAPLGGLDTRDDAERKREVLGTVAGFDTIQHRASEAGGLLRDEARDQAGLGLVAVDRAYRAENNSRYHRERAGIPATATSNPIDSIGLLAGVFEEQYSPVESPARMVADRRDHKRKGIRL